MIRVANILSTNMQDDPNQRTEVDRFIMDRIDSVPHLEALLLLWRTRNQAMSAEKLAKHLWVRPDVAKSILRDLVRDDFVEPVTESGEYRYNVDPNADRLIGLLEETYRRELIRVSTMIHSKPSSSVREFARAFRLKKEE